ncbi:MAG TPA: aminoglycoside phosphotransferase family protein [Mycobacteriales bacterium]|jgi:aminoglycoside phosphotransferase (APT) family kinase protein|nr:aminoglycoside phosphotransferase family protein [Mycobacteriales bacterium]
MIGIDVPLVRALVAAQFPQWADLEVRPVGMSGWDNRTFRLGPSMTVRLPSAAGYVPAVEKEQRWLPYLAPRLPLPIPVPLGLGRPGSGYPFPWSVYGWLDGDPTTPDRIDDPVGFARALAGFLVTLRGIDANGGPIAGEHSFWRGGPLASYDEETRRAIVTLGVGDTATAMWAEALGSAWTRPPVWFHGDIAPGNLLLRDGRLAAVIDFGTSGVGDPACDLVIAWTLLSGPARDAYREAVGLDEDTWARARGWALWKALITADSRVLAILGVQR